MSVTYIDYRKAVKNKYEKEKTGAHAAFLMNPSPAELLKLCLIVLDNGLDRVDTNTFHNYFKPKNNEDLKTCILNFESTSLKAVNFFLIGKTKEPNHKNLELVAVLVDFQPRPLTKFLQNNPYEPEDLTDKKKIVAKEEIIDRDKVIGKVEVIDKENNNADGIKTNVDVDNTYPGFEKEQDSNPVTVIPDNDGSSGWTKYIYYWITLICIGIVYLIKTNSGIDNQCMQWQNDHYQAIDCRADSPFPTAIIALEKVKLNFRQVHPKKDDSFMKDGEPIIWYAKQNGEVDFFNADGKHPLTDKKLGPANFYILQKYGK